MAESPEARIAWLETECAHLRALNESLRVEIRTQRKEIAGLREERRALFAADAPPRRNEYPEGGWIT